ncbi:MAG TPA: hypothetical protein VK912_14730 [Longimicrobiales bacterium]|nr:hypothetical protein [Longimicrobiales bacterium]
MRYHLFFPLLMLAALPGGLHAQNPDTARAALILKALSAAPPSVAEGATVLSGGGVIRQGTNGWVCFPGDPETRHNYPMCADEMWLEMFAALNDRRKPVISRVGISYMLQGGGGTSNTDPFADAPTADNEWMDSGPPHVMLVFPDAAVLDGISTDPYNGGPWVVWKNTPYPVLVIPSAPRTRR